MSRLFKALTPCLLLILLPVLLLPVAAYADQTDEANQLIAQAQAILAKANQLDQRAGELEAKLGQVDPAGKKAADALPILVELQGIVGEMQQDSASLKALYEQLSNLDVSEELKTWAGMQVEVTELNAQVFALMDDVFAKDKVVFGQWNELSQAERDQRIQEVTDLVNEASQGFTEVAAKDEAAKQYYADNDLATTLAGGSATTTELNTGLLIGIGVGSFIFAALFAFVCGYLAKRRGRSALGWAILGFLFPVIALILVLVLSDKTAGQAAAAEMPGAPAAPEALATAEPEVPPAAEPEPQAPSDSAPDTPPASEQEP
jgi:hypothetical protein